MSNCESVRNDLKAYLDGQLSLLRKSEVALHLAGCAACRQEADAMKRISGVLRTMDCEVLDLDMRAKILKSVANGEPAEAETEALPGRRG
jgi:anti-sigma factor RsiW